MNEISSSDVSTIVERRVFLSLSALLFFFAIVFPNSFQIITGGLLFASAVFALRFIQRFRYLKSLFAMYLAGAGVTVFYVLFGSMAGAPVEAIAQVFVIYIVSPLLWIVVSAGLASVVDRRVVQRWLIRYTLFAIVSVCMFFFLYLFVDPSLVLIFQEAPNVALGEGRIGTTMHVYGSLIFLAAGIFASPDVVKGSVARSFLLLALIAVVLTSGRHALISVLFLGAVVGAVVRATQMNFHRERLSSNFGVALFGAGVFVALLAWLLEFGQQIDLDLGLLYREIIEKIQEGGGFERSEQLSALLKGIAATGGMGAGHGIGVDYIRSEAYPWRYELVWVATVFRVGVVGAVIYALPFILYGLVFIKRALNKSLVPMDVCLFVGWMAGFVSSATNPYIESFSFQWMFIFPVVFFLANSSGDCPDGGSR